MNLATLISVIAIAVMLFLAVRSIYREKKKGNACIGCPYAGSCGKQKPGADCMSVVPDDKAASRER